MRASKVGVDPPTAGQTTTREPSVPWGRTLAAVARAVAGRPMLWPTAIAAVWRLAAPRWWRRWPPLPLPDPAYWRFRLLTAYGGRGHAVPDANDIVSYLRWCRGTREALR